MCLAQTPDAPWALPLRIPRTTLQSFIFSGTLSSTGKGSTRIGIGSPRRKYPFVQLYSLACLHVHGKITRFGRRVIYHVVPSFERLPWLCRVIVLEVLHDLLGGVGCAPLPVLFQRLANLMPHRSIPMLREPSHVQSVALCTTSVQVSCKIHALAGRFLTEAPHRSS